MNLLEAKPLPDKLSDCLEVALADLERCEKNPAYEIRMMDYHEPRGNVCSVCLAGAAMAGIGVPPNVDAAPGDFNHHNASRLNAISGVAVGDVFTGLVYMGVECPDSMRRLKSPIHLGEDRTEFKAYIRSAIEGLRKEGL